MQWPRLVSAQGGEALMILYLVTTNHVVEASKTPRWMGRRADSGQTSDTCKLCAVRGGASGQALLRSGKLVSS